MKPLICSWSKRFVDQDDLVFTWLAPRELDGDADWLPYAAVGIGATADGDHDVGFATRRTRALAKRETNQ